MLEIKNCLIHLTAILAELIDLGLEISVAVLQLIALVGAVLAFLLQFRIFLLEGLDLELGLMQFIFIVLLSLLILL